MAPAAGGNPQGGTGAKAGSQCTGSNQEAFSGWLPISMKPKDPRKGPCAVSVNPLTIYFMVVAPISMLQSVAVATHGRTIPRRSGFVKGSRVAAVAKGRPGVCGQAGPRSCRGLPLPGPFNAGETVYTNTANDCPTPQKLA